MKKTVAAVCLLLLPLVGFLPPEDARIQGTLTAIEQDLMVDGLIRRFLRLNNSPHPSAKDGQQRDEHTNPAKRLIQRIE